MQPFFIHRMGTFTLVKQFSESYHSKIAILELSSSSVKLTIGPRVLGSFGPEKFKAYKFRTKTRQGISGATMDPDFWADYVLPGIEKALEIAKTQGSKVYCVATEWAREVKNLPEIQENTPVKIRVLSSSEESQMALRAYLHSTRKDLSKYDNIVSIDSGSLSTEINVSGKSWISVLNTDPKKFAKIKQNFQKYLGDRNLVVTSETLYNPKTGDPWKMNFHDTELDLSRYYDKDSIKIAKLFGSSSLTVNGTGLGFGVYYSILENKIKI